MDIVKYEEFDVKNLDLLRRYDTINVWIDKENQPKDKHGIMASKLLIDCMNKILNKNKRITNIKTKNYFYNYFYVVYKIRTLVKE